jgi:prolyl 4-hydroxylase
MKGEWLHEYHTQYKLDPVQYLKDQMRYSGKPVLQKLTKDEMARRALESIETVYSSIVERDMLNSKCRLQRFLASPSSFASSKLSPPHVRGFHPLCLRLTRADGASSSLENKYILSIHAYPNGVNLPSGEVHHVHEIDADVGSSRDKLWASLSVWIENAVGIVDNLKDWRMFDANSREPITSVEKALLANEVFVFEGGKWIWPGVHVGHVHIVEAERESSRTPHMCHFSRGGNAVAMDSSLPASEGHIEKMILETISMQPLVFKVHRFLTNEECDWIIKVGREEGVMSGRTQAPRNPPWRNSTHTWLNTALSHIAANDLQQQQIVRSRIAELDKRVEVVSGVEETHHEGVKIVRYRTGEWRNTRRDAFDEIPEVFGEKAERAHKWQKGSRSNRLAIMVFYLNSVPVGEGGETFFPEAREGDLKVVPEKGSAVLAYTLLPNGEVDPYADRASLPLTTETSEKWVVEKYIWNGMIKEPFDVVNLHKHVG